VPRFVGTWLTSHAFPRRPGDISWKQPARPAKHDREAAYPPRRGRWPEHDREAGYPARRGRWPEHQLELAQHNRRQTRRKSGNEGSKIPNEDREAGYPPHVVMVGGKRH
jgi:hypothetical protein